MFAPGGVKHILVVDDDPAVSSFLKNALSGLGHSVDTCASAKEALLRLQQRTYQLVITDLCMPGLSGMEVLKFVRARMPEIPVVLLTAYGTIENAVEVMKVGAFDYLSKPSSLEKLKAVVNRVHFALPSGAGHGILTQNRKMIDLLDLARRAAAAEATILIEGESGTGKELLARYIHQESGRKEKPFVAVNCAALPESLLESELFGYEKGSFTGAFEGKPGKFELAHEGTLLLDEITELAPLAQAKLLRVIQEREVDRIGATRLRPVRVRIIATANRNLRETVREGKFRADLYHRLNVVKLRVPALRERKEDLPLLVSAFIQRYAKGRNVQIQPKYVEVLQNYYWPGNVRELENAVQRVLALRGEGEIKDLLLLPEEWDTEAELNLPVGHTLEEIEKIYIVKTLEETGGNRTRTSEILGIAVRTLQYKLKKYRLEGHLLKAD